MFQPCLRAVASTVRMMVRLVAPGPAAEASGDLLLHLFGPHALFRAIIGGRNFGIDREHQHRVPMVPQPEDEIVSRPSFPASAPPG